MPSPIADEGLGLNIGHHAGHKQRMPFGVVVEPLRKHRWQCPLRKALGQIGLHRRHGQPLQFELDALPVQVELLGERAQGLAVEMHIGRPIGAENEQTGRRAPPGQQPDQVQSGPVAPVQVLEHQHQRLLRRQHL